MIRFREFELPSITAEKCHVHVRVSHELINQNYISYIDKFIMIRLNNVKMNSIIITLLLFTLVGLFIKF